MSAQVLPQPSNSVSDRDAAVTCPAPAAVLGRNESLFTRSESDGTRHYSRAQHPAPRLFRVRHPVRRPSLGLWSPPRAKHRSRRPSGSPRGHTGLPTAGSLETRCAQTHTRRCACMFSYTPGSSAKWAPPHLEEKVSAWGSPRLFASPGPPCAPSQAGLPCFSRSCVGSIRVRCKTAALGQCSREADVHTRAQARTPQPPPRALLPRSRPALQWRPQTAGPSRRRPRGSQALGLTSPQPSQVSPEAHLSSGNSQDTRAPQIRQVNGGLDTTRL